MGASSTIVHALVEPARLRADAYGCERSRGFSPGATCAALSQPARFDAEDAVIESVRTLIL
jgi:hypothetical protein